MAGDTIMKSNKEKQAKICTPSTVLNPWQVFPFFSTTIIPPETPPISTRKEISLHSHWSGCDNHERNSLPKAITAPSAVPTSQTQWRWACAFMAAAPWQGLENADWCDFLWSCMCMDLLSLFLLQSQQNSAEISQQNWFFLCCPAVKHFYLLSNSSLQLPSGRNTDESTCRMQTRMLARGHFYFLLDSWSTSHLFPYTASTPHLPV